MLDRNPRGSRLNERERVLARRRIQAINEELLPEAMESLAEVEGATKRYLDAQLPRNRSEDKLHLDMRDRLKRARAWPKLLKEEEKILNKMMKESLMAEELALQAEGERKAVEFLAKAQRFTKEVSDRPDSVPLVIELAKILDGESIERTYLPFLKARYIFEDLQTKRRYISEEYNITLDELPQQPDFDYVDNLKAAIEKLLGKPLKIERNLNWQRVRANQRGADRDAAAESLEVCA